MAVIAVVVDVLSFCWPCLSTVVLYMYNASQVVVMQALV